MLLLHKNCKIEISEEKIECEYLYLMNKTIHWEISLKETLKLNEIVLFPDEIIEFQFEIEDRSQKGHNLTQEAVIYYLKRNEKELVEFFRFCVIEEVKLSSQTKSYEFANEILKAISNKYNIPFSFKYYIETKKKRKGLESLIIMLMIIWVLLMLMKKLS